MRRIALFKLIGELFNVGLLVDRIIHECIQELMGDGEFLLENDQEAACALIATAGKSLDRPKGTKCDKYMPVYFRRLHKLLSDPDISKQLRTIVRRVIEQRERKWRPAVTDDTERNGKLSITTDDFTEEILVSSDAGWQNVDHDQQN
jgi:translation initiation factor 4G